ncbi:uncharacterized protein BJ171DRAFT_518457 [Polychytrium aggregatum]|uniref:uncharacterized protein n=1 Tax=Polychytrium aggregatum TaxID=110093 RepID=UPI0022FE88F3|nr:uncharacterized protein BJ171DRAFT_518457 [Polychytrium aggregatum]KAI9199448.1 hypothetical protein BJ171DRAFT_518457 [Polychytrium aggregatum]
METHSNSHESSVPADDAAVSSALEAPAHPPLARTSYAITHVNPWEAGADLDEVESSFHQSILSNPVLSPSSIMSGYNSPRLSSSGPHLGSTRGSSNSSSLSILQASATHTYPHPVVPSALEDEDPWSRPVPSMQDALGIRPSASAPPAAAEEGLVDVLPNPTVKSLRSSMSRSSSALSDFQWYLNVENISVKIAPVKGGVIFKHVNYLLESQTSHNLITRRYSDFAWLSTILYKRYPSRLLPTLPPKAVGGQSDPVFLEKRRRGLLRFINFIVNHPVLHADSEVVEFLQSKDFTQHRKATQVLLNEEFLGDTGVQDRLVEVPADLDERLTVIRGDLVPSIHAYQNMAVSIERFSKRAEASSSDLLRYSTVLSPIPEKHLCIEKECQSCAKLNLGFHDLSNGFQRIARTYNELAHDGHESIIEGLKTYRDLLVSLVELLDRRDKVFATISIESLKNKIAATHARLSDAQSKGNSKEIERLVKLINQDDQELATQLRKLDFYRWSLWQELRFFHQQKAHLSRIYQSYVTFSIRSAQQLTEGWQNLSETVFEMPTSGYI